MTPRNVVGRWIAAAAVLALLGGSAAVGAERRERRSHETWDEHWEHFGEQLGRDFERFGETLGRQGEEWGRFGERVGRHWGERGESWGEHWGSFGEEMGEHWGAYGERLGEHWGDFGERMGERWGDFGGRVGERFGEAWSGRDRAPSERFEALNDELPEIVELTVESVMDALDTLLEAFDDR